MELIVCLLLASILTGGRLASDIVHGVRGATPPHVEKARLRVEKARIKAQTKPTPKARSAYADGKPKLRDVAAVYWGDAMADAIDWHNRRRDERGTKVRTPLRERVRQFGLLLWRPVGEKPPTVIDSTTSKGDTVASIQEQTERTAQAQSDAKQALNLGDHSEAQRIVNGERYQQMVDGSDDTTARNIRDSQAPMAFPNTPAGTGAPTGEAVNYETTVAELEAIIAQLRTHLDSAQAAHASIQKATADINNAQASYNPAATAAGSVNEHLAALNLDAQTVSHTGTVANALPPNAVNNMFDQLEEMEAAAAEQVANAEAALGSAEEALKTVTEKYGDANATVQSELAGDSRFLAGTAA